MTFGILLTSTVVGTAEAMLAEYLAQSRKAVAIMSGKEIGTFQPQRSSLAKPSLLSTQCRRKSAPRRLKFKRSPLPTSSRTSYAIEISQQRCICGRARILGNPADFDLAARALFLRYHCRNAARHAKRSHQYRRARARSHQPPANKPLAFINRFVPALTVVADDDAHFDWRRLFAASCGVGRWPIAV